jgi:acetyltransferase-like isoleucine patch superfamily enzyme
MAERFMKWKKPTIKHGIPTKWHWIVWKPEHLRLGKRVDIGALTCIFAHYGVEIGDDVQIGSHCSIYSVNTIENKHGKVTIKKGACIGTHSSVVQGVTIGEGAIVGAHSFVNKDIPPYSLAVGVPARVVKKLKRSLKK